MIGHAETAANRPKSKSSMMKDRSDSFRKNFRWSFRSLASLRAIRRRFVRVTVTTKGEIIY